MEITQQRMLHSIVVFVLVVVVVGQTGFQDVFQDSEEVQNQ